MRISDRYIGKQVFHDALLAVAVLSVVLILGTLFREIRQQLVEQKMPLGLVLRFILSVMPSTLMYTLPWGFLSAVLLVFGRLSSKQELTAFRVAGISLPRLAVPVFIIGTVLSLLCLWVNTEMAPAAKQSISRQLLEAAKSDPRSLLDAGAVSGRFKGLKVFVTGRDGDALRGVHVYKYMDAANGKKKSRAYLYAGSASLVNDKPKQQLRATLDNAYIEVKHSDGSFDDTAWPQQAEPWFFDYSTSGLNKLRKSAMTNAELRREILKRQGNTPIDRSVRESYRIEIAKRYSFSLACLSFAFIAVPLGIGARRKETSTGMVMSLLIGTGYFFFIMIAEQAKSPRAADLLLWTPNILCVVIGLFLFRRARFK